MERDINITLRFKLSIGETNLNEIVYGLKEFRDGLMLQILEQILRSYDDLISDRLSHTEIYPSKARKGLGRHVCKDDPNGLFCRGRKVYKRGYRQEPRKIATVFGELVLAIRTVTCRRCGARYSPLLSALKIGAYARKEMNFENEVIEAVIDTNYRRLIDGRSIDISLGGIHNIVVGNYIDNRFEEPVRSRIYWPLWPMGPGLNKRKVRRENSGPLSGLPSRDELSPWGALPTPLGQR